MEVNCIQNIIFSIPDFNISISCWMIRQRMTTCVT